MAEMLHGSGFVAAFAGGLAFAWAARRVGSHPETHVSEAAGQLLELTVFAMFGGYAVITGFRDAGWRVIVFAVVTVFAVRLVVVSLALLRSDVPLRERLFIGWFGPRGIGTVVLGLIVVERGQIEQESLIIQVVVVTVTLSLVVHSLTAWPGIRWLGARELADGPTTDETQASEGTPAQDTR
jgi:NhaP-type Na+/H+ or K+/H+ antiporter